MQSFRPMLACLALASVCAVAAPAAEPYRWPLDLPRVLTSSFAEYRAAGYHMGIDLRTGTPGKDVFAAGDGYIERVRCSPYGYGKAVYLKLDDGHTVVYAHLNGYTPELREYLRAEQHRRERYAVDLYPEKERFRVSRGDLIAQSGQTGIGAPHLHFEVRNPAGTPIDPRRIGFEWPDQTPPVIRAVLIEAAAPDVLVNGGFRPQILQATKRSDGTFRVPEVSVSGPLRFSVYATDSGSARGTRLGIARAELTTDDTSLFSLYLDAVSYAHYRDGAVAFHPYHRKNGRFLTLWPWPGNGVQSYNGDTGLGVFDPANGAARIAIADTHGNAATVDTPIAFARDAAPEAPAGIGKGAGTVRYEPAPGWVICIVRFSEAEPDPPAIHVEGGRSPELGFVRTSAREFQTTIEPDLGQFTMTVRVEHPRVEDHQREFAVFRRGQTGRSYVDDGVRIVARPESAYGTLLVSVEHGAGPKILKLRSAGEARYLWHEDHPVGAPLRVTLSGVADARRPERVHVYRFNGGAWQRMDTERTDEGLSFETRHLGWFRALEDIYAPHLRVTSPPNGYHSKTRRPIVKARLEDVHSGVDEYGITANGDWLLTAYDPEHGEIRWERDEDLPSGETIFELWARDHAGNEARKQVKVVIP